MNPDSTLHIGLSSILEEFDPAIANPTAKVDLDVMYDHLVGLNAAGTDVSKATGVFSDWTTTDNKVWVFTIRPGFQFQDGTPVTAADIKFSLDRLQLPAATSAYSAWFKGNVATTDITNPTTITITLKAASFQLPIYLSSLTGNEGDVLPMAYFAKVGEAGFEKAPMGTGPYALTGHEPGVSITYTRVHCAAAGGFQRRQVQVRRLHDRRVVSDAVGAVADRGAGRHRRRHLRCEDPQRQVRLQRHRQTSRQRSGHQLLPAMDRRLPLRQRPIPASPHRGRRPRPDQHRHLRRPRQSHRHLPQQRRLHRLPTPTAYPYNPTEAKTLLKQSGYSGQQITIYGFPLPGIPELPDVAQAIQGFWSAIGVNVTVTPIDYASFQAKWIAFSLPGIAASPVGFADRALGLALYQNGFGSKGGTTVTHDPTLDALLGHRHRPRRQRRPNRLRQSRRRPGQIRPRQLPQPPPRLPLQLLRRQSPHHLAAGDGQYDINVRNLVGG